jgi:hypothetical protein
VAVGLGAAALRPGDVVAPGLLAEYAEQTAPSDWTAPVWVDAHRAATAVRPWQRGFVGARALRARIERQRRAMLSHPGLSTRPDRT